MLQHVEEHDSIEGVIRQRTSREIELKKWDARKTRGNGLKRTAHIIGSHQRSIGELVEKILQHHPRRAADVGKHWRIRTEQRRNSPAAWRRDARSI